MKNFLNRTIRALMTAFNASGKVAPEVPPPALPPTDPSLAPEGDSTRVLMDFAFHQQAEFQTHMRNRLIASHRDLEALSTVVGLPDAPPEAGKRLEALRASVIRLNRELDQAKCASDMAWKDFKLRLRDEHRAFSGCVQDLRQWANARIVP